MVRMAGGGACLTSGNCWSRPYDLPFLAVTHRVDADVLVIKGWVHEYAIRTAISEFQSGHYQRVFTTTGGPGGGMSGYTNDHNTSAGVGAGHLKAADFWPN